MVCANEEKQIIMKNSIKENLFMHHVLASDREAEYVLKISLLSLNNSGTNLNDLKLLPLGKISISIDAWLFRPVALTIFNE